MPKMCYQKNDHINTITKTIKRKKKLKLKYKMEIINFHLFK
jgi:hypothetical protein